MDMKCKVWLDFLTMEIEDVNCCDERRNINQQLSDELKLAAKAENAEEELYERFYKEIEFGTGGLRGILGAGTNRMNIYTVAKATQGIADYICSGEYLTDSPLKGKKAKATPSVAIAYDSRINSKLFARISAEVLNANGIDVYLYDELMPTPAVSYAVRRFECSMGIMITASHNPAKYNGYKVYDNSGCQVTLEAAEKIYGYIQKLDIFKDVKRAGGSGSLTIIGEEEASDYLDAVQRESTLKAEEDKAAIKELNVVYTPLNGAGNKPVRQILSRIGVENITIVKEQELPDGNFPTCPYPNPEKKEALALGLKTCEELASKGIKENKAEEIVDLLLATDPDCDRVGIAVREGEKGMRLLSGNEVGVLLLDFLISKKVKTGEKKNPALITTIVSTRMTDAIAEKNGVKLIRTLTGFKFIGEQIGFMENENREEDFLFGFEESYGYLSGAYVRDKDAVNASMLICEMAAYYKKRGMTLADRLKELYEEYGYYKNDLVDFAFEGAKGMETMKSIMRDLRENLPDEFVGKRVKEIADYEKQERKIVLTEGFCGMSEAVKSTNLPKSDVIEVELEDGSSFAVRPSGTEPKLKIYLSAKGEEEAQADYVIQQLSKELSEIVQSR